MAEIIFTWIFALSGFALGYLVGKLQERICWNRLIEQGKIPRPKGKFNA